MTDDRYDDGLVHGHAWATEPPAHIAATPMQEPQTAPAMSASPEKDDTFDDGLVHAHGWARSGDGAG